MAGCAKRVLAGKVAWITAERHDLWPRVLALLTNMCHAAVLSSLAATVLARTHDPAARRSAQRLLSVTYYTSYDVLPCSSASAALPVGPVCGRQPLHSGRQQPTACIKGSSYARMCC
jgi:hypothetical protein